MQGSDPKPGRRAGPAPVWAAALVALGLVATAAAASPTPSSRPLFDGRTLAGWEGGGCWSVEDGAITGTIAEGQMLAANEFLWWSGGELGDFELALDVRVVGHATANSGVQVRSERLPDGSARGYQADIDAGAEWFGRIYDEHGRGLLVERGRRLAIAPDGRRWEDDFATIDEVRAAIRPGEWNRYVIRATASHLAVWINGVAVAVLDDCEAKQADFSGRLALQLHSGPGPVKIQFRDVRLTDLGRTAPWPPGPEPGSLPAAAGRAATSPVLWHLARNPGSATTVANEKALAAVNEVRLTPGFRLDLLAAEPDLRQPIAFCFDDRGRIWVAEAYGYPLRRPDGEGRDRILVFADRDGDGSLESRSVFADGLNLVSGLEVGFGGVWVGAAPHLLFIPDRDGDDVPDGPPEVLLDGWGHADTHETLNSFAWGPDGWLYGLQGVFTPSNVGKPGATDAERIAFSCGTWRYHPVSRRFELFCRGGSNPWGIDFNAVGDAFSAHCRSQYGGGGTSHLIRNAHTWTQMNRDYAPFICAEPPQGMPWLKNYLPAAARYDSGAGGAGKKGSDAVYGGHSHVGTLVYQGDDWPAIYRGRIFTHNLHGRQLNHQEVVRRGSGYEVTHAGFDMLFNPDPQYVAVDLQTGPDGGVYVIDWCDLQHCHSDVDDKWDRDNGRLTRLVWAEHWKPVAVNLGRAADAALVALHGHANEWHVRTARRLLQERAAAGRLDRSTLAPLPAAARDADAVTALRALWTLHVTGGLDDGLLLASLAHADDRVRGWAVTLATETPGTPRVPADRLVELAVGDPSPVVRRTLASALPAVPDADRWRIAEALAMHGEDASDRFLPGLVWSGIAPLVPSDPDRALGLAARSPLPLVADSIRWHAARLPQPRERLVAWIAAAPPEAAMHAVEVMAAALDKETKLPPPAGWERVTARFGAGPDRPAVEALAALFGDAEVRGRLRGLLADAAAEPAARRRALAILSRLADPESVPVFTALLDDPAFRGAVIPLLGRSHDTGAARRLMAIYTSLDQPQRQAVIGALAASPPMARELLAAVADRSFPSAEVTAVHVRQLRSLKDPAIDAAVDGLWGRVSESPAEVKQTIGRLQGEYYSAPKPPLDHPGVLDRGRGRAVFARACAGCHVLAGEGQQVGPNLTGAWSNGLGYFLEHVVNPNAVVGPAYQMTTFALADGTVVNGIVLEENASAVVVRTATATVTIPRGDIDERVASSASLMPAGLLETMPKQDALDLLYYLISRP